METEGGFTKQILICENLMCEVAGSYIRDLHKDLCLSPATKGRDAGFSLKLRRSDSHKKLLRWISIQHYFLKLFRLAITDPYSL